MIQSMTNTRTEDVAATVAQIHRLEKAGCEIVRCTVPTQEAARAVREIKKQIPAYLVLHGGSGVPAEMVIRSYEIEGGGISKVNIATDLELAFLEAIGAAQRGTDAWCSGLEEAVLEKGRKGVRDMVTDKMIHYLHSNQKAF